jgi:N-acyl-D-aspartate/D-glutamate deacylase
MEVAMLDLLIKDGVVVDGTGQTRFSGSVGIVGNRIVELGRVTTPARRTLHADGRLITPGFVDIHTHLDGQVSWDTMLSPSSFHGVTSVVMGNCGVGFAPARPHKHDWLIQLLEGVEDIPGTALAVGLTWDWESFTDYLDALAKRTYTLDVGAQLPHAPLRAYVMGDRGADPTQDPTDTEVGEIERLTFEALESGAMGFSTSRSYIHRSRNGENIGTLKATHRELSAAARAMRRANQGVFQLITDAYLSSDPNFVRSEMDLIRTLAIESGRHLSFTVVEYDAVPDRWRELFAAIQQMVDAGLVVRGQVAPRPVGAIGGLLTSVTPFESSATFRGLRSLRVKDRVEQLRKPAIKARVLAEYRSRSDKDYSGMSGMFSRMFRLTDPVDYEPPSDLSILAQAERAGRTPDEYVYDVLLEEDGRRLLYIPVVNYLHGNLDDIYHMMTNANALYGLSDSGAHCAALCDASFPTTSLALWNKGSKNGLRIPVETLIHGYTQRNAAHVGWLDRGVIAPGYLADINVIDIDNLRVTVPEILGDLPTGATRIVQRAEGYRWTVKRGVVTFDNGHATGELPGRLQRGRQMAPHSLQ